MKTTRQKVACCASALLFSAITFASGAAASAPEVLPTTVKVGDVRVGFSIGDVASGQMKSLSVTTNGNVVTAVWKGHPSCGDGFTVTADLALLPGGGFEYASFRYAGKDDGQPVSRISFPEITVPRTGRTAIFRPNTVGEVYRPDWKGLLAIAREKYGTQS